MIISITTRLYIRSLEFIHLISGNLYPSITSTHSTPFPPHSFALILCFYEFGFWDCTYKCNHTVFFLLWLTFLLTWCPQGSTMLFQRQPFLLFSWLNSVSLERAMAPHSSTLAWKIPWTEEPGGQQSMGSLRVGHDWSDLAAAAAVFHCGFPGSLVGKESACSERDPGSTPGLGRSPGEWNGKPLKYSCLENSMDRGAWWASVHGITRVGHYWSDLAAAANNASVKKKKNNTGRIMAAWSSLSSKQQLWFRKNPFWADCVLCDSNYIAYNAF